MYAHVNLFIYLLFFDTIECKLNAYQYQYLGFDIG